LYLYTFLPATNTARPNTANAIGMANPTPHPMLSCTQTSTVDDSSEPRLMEKRNQFQNEPLFTRSTGSVGTVKLVGAKGRNAGLDATGPDGDEIEPHVYYDTMNAAPG
jgi:hypothetical protein